MQYPIYCKSKLSSLEIKFTALTQGTVTVPNNTYEEGEQSSSWVAHTDPDIWTEIPAPPPPINLYF